MGYHVIDTADLDPSPGHPCDRRSVAEAAGLGGLAAAVYDLAPGEDLATTYHYHEQREELLYVLAGTLHVETPDREYAVGADEVFVVEPESPIRPYNPADADGRARVFGVGAPAFDPGRPYEPDS
jgi:quercetin dioxygenase-like cupin family protein